MILTEAFLKKALAKTCWVYAYYEIEPNNELSEEDREIFNMLVRLPGSTITRAIENYQSDFACNVLPFLLNELHLNHAESWYIAEKLSQTLPNNCWPPVPDIQEACCGLDPGDVDIRASLYAAHFDEIVNLACIRDRCSQESEEDPAGLLIDLIEAIIRREVLAQEWLMGQAVKIEEDPEQDKTTAIDSDLPIIPDESITEIGIYSNKVGQAVVQIFEAFLDQVLVKRNEVKVDNSA